MVYRRVIVVAESVSATAALTGCCNVACYAQTS